MSLAPDLAHELEAILEQRFGERIAVDPTLSTDWTGSSPSSNIG